MKKKPLVVGNWKMYVEKPDEAKRFVSSLKRKAAILAKVDVVLAPPFTLLGVVAASAKGSSVHAGGQSVSPYEEGAHTGEVSAQMLKAAGASWVIIGHSERRSPAPVRDAPTGAGEDMAHVRAQVERAHAAGLMTIVCVGEAERDPSGAHFTTIAQQLSSALANGVGTISPNKIVIAYEPVWAIGKSAAEAMQPVDLREMVIFIRKTLADILGRAVGVRVPVLYGGSVDATNAPHLLRDGDIAGFLVGRASANLSTFVELIQVIVR